MNDLLKIGQIVQTKSGQPCRVDKFLGGGGQGEVYSAAWGNGQFALKWYFKHTATSDQRKALEDLVQAKAPSDAFLWPLDMAFSNEVPGYGYLMRLREARFKGLFDFVLGRIDPDPCFRELVTVGLGLADNFYKLHSEGLCYCDISFGNAFFDPATGEVLICDNDNVTANRSPRVSVLGTPDFMAPEVVRGQASPSRQTDLYSLAILLFYLFHIQHPLMGRRMLSIRSWDLPARTKMLGTEPLFIFDPHDRSNEAVDKHTDPLGEAGHNALLYWPIYPQFLRDSFIKSFTTGLHDPEHGRVTEGEWRRVLSRLRDSIYFCSCGMENFYDPDAVKAGKTPVCWACQKELRLPFRIRIDKSIIMLTHQGQLFPHHLDSSKEFDFSQPSAEVQPHPTEKGVWGLKNCTTEKWVSTLPDGSTRDIDSGRSVKLTNGTRIAFGKSEGEIRY